MKRKALSYLLVALLCLVILLIVGKTLFITPIERDIEQQRTQGKSFKQELGNLQVRINALKKQIGDGTVPPTLSLMAPGKESEVVQTVFSLASSAEIVIEGFNLKPVFQLKRIEEDQPETPAARPLQSQGLPQLDENGMPVGAVSSEDDLQAGLEVVPVRIELKGTYRNWGLFLKSLRESLPLTGLRSLLLNYSSTGVHRGMVEFVLPVGTALPESSVPANSTSETGGEEPNGQ